MFRWYQNAARCYVYLSDVSHALTDRETDRDDAPWVHEFRQCRWFTRGWTLQELLAPRLVDFYSASGEKLGSRVSLERHISAVTGIPVRALRGPDLSTFTVEERFSWQETRHTMEPEDKAYSMIGIFGTSIPVIYGEGKDRALARLRKEIEDTSKGIPITATSL